MFLSGDESASPHDWESAFTQYRQARDEYYRYARRSLGVPGVAVSRDQTWPPRWRHPAP